MPSPKVHSGKNPGVWVGFLCVACGAAGAGLVPESCLTLAAAWAVARQAPLSVGFSRQENWNELPFPSPGDLPYPGIEPGSPALQADFLLSESPGKHMTQKFYFWVYTKSN